MNFITSVTWVSICFFQLNWLWKYIKLFYIYHFVHYFLYFHMENFPKCPFKNHHRMQLICMHGFIFRGIFHSHTQSPFHTAPVNPRSAAALTFLCRPSLWQQHYKTAGQEYDWFGRTTKQSGPLISIWQDRLTCSPPPHEQDSAWSPPLIHTQRSTSTRKGSSPSCVSVMWLFLFILQIEFSPSFNLICTHWLPD